MEYQITKSQELDWKPLVEPGINTEGISVKVLRMDEVTNRSPSFLLKFEAGASYPNHIHPAGEEIYVLEGEIRFGNAQLHQGDFLYSKPGSTHSAFSKTGCTMLFIVPEEVVILK